MGRASRRLVLTAGVAAAVTAVSSAAGWYWLAFRSAEPPGVPEVVAPALPPLEGRLRATLGGHAGDMEGLAYAADGKTLAAAGSQDRAVTLWDPATLRKAGTLDPGEGWTCGPLAFAADGKTLAAVHRRPEMFTYRVRGSATQRMVVGGQVRLWDLAGRRALKTLRPDWPRGITSIALSPDGATLAARELWGRGRQTRTQLALWDVARSSVRAQAPASCLCVAFAPDGSSVATGGWYLDVRLWNPDDAGLQEMLPLPGPPPIGPLGFAPLGRLLAGGHATSGRVVVWDLVALTPRIILSPGAGDHGAAALAFSPDGRTLAVAINPPEDKTDTSAAGDIFLWDTDTWRLRGRLSLPGAITSLAWSPDSRTLAAGGRPSGQTSAVLLFDTTNLLER